MNTIKVNGLQVQVLNQWATAPGQAPHTYRVLSNGFVAHVFKAMAGWRIQIDGCRPTVAQVER